MEDRLVSGGNIERDVKCRNTMKAAVWHGRRDIRIEPFPDPGPPARDEVRIQVAWCGICGTDLEEYLHGPLFIPAEKPNPLTGRTAPMVLGHEFVGVVTEVGSAIADLKPGDHVAVDTLLHCGDCYYCRRHMVHLCEKLAIMGLSTDGGLAEFVNAPRYMCFKYPDTLEDAHAALAEPTSVAVRAVRRSRLAAGETVVIVGAGTVGLLTLEVAKAMGAERIMVLEPAENRRRIAAQLGAVAVIDPNADDPVLAIHALTGGLGADVVFECAGTVKTMELSPLLARKGGRVVMVGLHKAPVNLQLFPIVTGEQEIIGSFSHVYDEDFGLAVELLSSGKITAEPLITARIKMDDLVRQGLEELATSKSHHLKILVSPRG
jgi:(R,R)-butanediol dehydrogenase/meso-butanediol dehydrogenase/diacetyl reductase